MAIERFSVRLLSKTKSKVEGLFIFDEAADGDSLMKTLKFQFINGEVTGNAPDYFEAMCQIRNALETDGWRPICYGSSRNVYPSGMARDMGRGLRAYKLELGRRGALTDLVSIFDCGPDVQPSSVEEQERFWNEWRRSIGIKA